MDNQNDKFTTETVLWTKYHTPNLLSFAITRPSGYRFSAGQFARLGTHRGEAFLWRAYSMVSAPHDDYLSFYAVLVPDGLFSQHLATLAAGSPILLDKTAQGFLLPERFNDGCDLVLLSTGTGLAPFLSILSEPFVWERFEKIALVHSVSHADALTYQSQISEFKDHPLLEDFGDKLVYQAVVTREPHPNALQKRIPDLILDGELEQSLGFEFSTDTTRFMVCGNPSMVIATHKSLMQKGFALHRNKIPGHIVLENGF